ncbi:MAG: hypothetical protein V1933_04850 [Candidatus Omnitrophota bacterium]
MKNSILMFSGVSPKFPTGMSVLDSEVFLFFEQRREDKNTSSLE